MTFEHLLSVAVILNVAVPLAASVVALLFTVFRRPAPEAPLAGLAALTCGASVLSALVILAAVLFGSSTSYEVSFGNLHATGGYAIELEFLLDRLSAPLLVLISVVAGLIARFSVTYMHRDPGFGRFYVLLLLFMAGANLLVAAGTMDLLLAGWELVGLSSVLLIGFYKQRHGPIQSGFRAFLTYRACDLGLLLAAVVLHHEAHSTDIALTNGGLSWPLSTAHLPLGAATSVGLLLLWASLGKSAQFPFTDWLPRAMEGPTSSSALFYGGISVHLGAYLLLRNAPVIGESWVTRIAVIAVGVTTAVMSTILGRTRNDAKTQLAYASSAQVGVIFIEIGVGLDTLALFHLLGHASFRTLQLLRAPSLLHARLNAGFSLDSSPGERVAPWERSLYSGALFRFGVDAALESLIVRPLLAVGRLLDAADRGGRPDEAKSDSYHEPPRPSLIPSPAGPTERAR